MSALRSIFEIDFGHRLDDAMAKLDYFDVIRMNRIRIQYRPVIKDRYQSCIV